MRFAHAQDRNVRSLAVCLPARNPPSQRSTMPALRSDRVAYKRLPYIRPCVAPATLEAMQGDLVYQLTLPTVLLLLLGFYSSTCG